MDLFMGKSTGKLHIYSMEKSMVSCNFPIRLVESPMSHEHMERAEKRLRQHAQKTVTVRCAKPTGTSCSWGETPGVFHIYLKVYHRLEAFAETQFGILFFPTFAGWICFVSYAVLYRYIKATRNKSVYCILILLTIMMCTFSWQSMFDGLFEAQTYSQRIVVCFNT